MCWRTSCGVCGCCGNRQCGGWTNCCGCGCRRNCGWGWGCNQAFNNSSCCNNTRNESACDCANEQDTLFESCGCGCCND